MSKKTYATSRLKNMTLPASRSPLPYYLLAYFCFFFHKYNYTNEKGIDFLNYIKIESYKLFLYYVFSFKLIWDLSSLVYISSFYFCWWHILLNKCHQFFCHAYSWTEFISGRYIMDDVLSTVVPTFWCTWKHFFWAKI